MGRFGECSLCTAVKRIITHFEIGAPIALLQLSILFLCLKFYTFTNVYVFKNMKSVKYCDESLVCYRVISKREYFLMFLCKSFAYINLWILEALPTKDYRVAIMLYIARLLFSNCCFVLAETRLHTAFKIYFNLFITHYVHWNKCGTKIQLFSKI